MPVTISRAEQLQNQHVQLFQGITVEDGYRTTVQNVYPVPVLPNAAGDSFPYICVVLGRETVRPTTSNWNLVNTDLAVEVAGFIQAQAEGTGIGDEAMRNDYMEALLHDMRRVLVANLLVNINATPNRWRVKRESIVADRWPIPNTLGGWVTLSFTCEIQNLDASLND